jgi:hypothetical protein
MQLSDVEYLTGRLTEKLRDIKTLIAKYLKEGKIKNPVENTLEAFNVLFPIHKTNQKHRMKQLYSYDVRDS